MKKNEGSIDRGLRVALGLALLAAGLIFSTPWALIGIIPLVTGIVGFCPLYRLVGLNTCDAKECA